MRLFHFLLALFVVMVFNATTVEARPVNVDAVSTTPSVLVVMLENHSYAQVAGHMPYLNNLASQNTLLTHESAITHPSLPNYIALTAGDTFGIKDDGSPTQHKLGQDNIFSQLGSTGWKVYNQFMPSPCFKGNKQPYVVHHNPPPYFTNLASDCAANDVSDASFASDVSAGTLRPYTMLIPDKCHDGHSDSNCGGPSDGTARADAYLSQVVPMIQSGPQYQNGSLLIELVWDEGKNSSQIVYTVMVGRGTHGTVNTTLTHYSILKYNENLLGVPCLLNACTAPTMVLP